MVKSVATLLGIAATVLSFNLPANERTRGIALAELGANTASVANSASPAHGAASLISLSTTEPADKGPANAWLYALGFLGLVVLRRTRSGPMM